MFKAAGANPGGTATIDQVNPDIMKDPAATNKKIQLLFLACGTEDPRLPSLKLLWASLQEHGIRFTAKTYPGEHEWKVWRHSLVDMSQLLFR